MHGLRWVAIASLLGPAAACANVWGFETLVPREGDGGSDASGDSDDAAQDVEAGMAESDASDEGMVAGGCNLANSGVCKYKCTDDASPCGCLSDQFGATLCGVMGSGISGASCTSDTDCAPGYGCMASIPRTCSHWCRPGSTVCPVGVCNTGMGLMYNGALYGFCY
jgi:hypothetical protein